MAWIILDLFVCLLGHFWSRIGIPLDENHHFAPAFGSQYVWFTFSSRIMAEIVIMTPMEPTSIPAWIFFRGRKAEEHLPGRPRILPQRHHVFFFSLEG